jgi:hypothetical protein
MAPLCAPSCQAGSGKKWPVKYFGAVLLVGFGAGRSTVDARLVVVDGEKEAASVRIRVRGNLIFPPYEGGNTLRRQAVNSFQQRVLEEIYKLK